MQDKQGPVAFASARTATLPHVKCDAKHEAKLLAIINRARGAGYDFSAFDPRPGHVDFVDMMNGSGAVATVAEVAVRWLLHEKNSGATAAEFRAMIKGGKKGSELHKAVEKLFVLLPDSGSAPPWPQLRAEFAGGNPFGQGLSLDGDPAKEDTWDLRYQPGALKEVLKEYLRLMDRLFQRASGTRPPQLPEKAFVENLAKYWTDRLNLPIRGGRGAHNHQAGEFPNFVRTVRELYEKYRRACPDDEMRARLQLGSLDGHIRSVTDESRQDAT